MAKPHASILVLAAHPDDEVLGCGATLLKWKDAGHKITVAFGGTGREGGRQAEEAEAVARTAGWRLWGFGPFQDNAFGPVKDVAAWIEEILSTEHPSRILVHTQHELNQDHHVMRHASEIACRLFTHTWKPPLGQSRELWAFEVPGSTTPEFRPNVFVDTASHAHRKEQVLALYASESRVSPHPRSQEALMVRGQHWGSFVGLRYAEAFRLEALVIGQTSGTAS